MDKHVVGIDSIGEKEIAFTKYPWSHLFQSNF